MGAENYVTPSAAEEKQSLVAEAEGILPEPTVPVSTDEGAEIAVNTERQQAKGDDRDATKDKDMAADQESVADDAIPLPAGYAARLLGVYRVLYSPRPPLALPTLAGVRTLLSSTARSTAWFAREIHAVNRARVRALLVLDAVRALVPTALLFLTNRMLNLIEAGVKDGKLDTRAITTTLIARSVLSIFALVISSLRTKTERKLKTQVGLHFRHLQLRAGLERARDSPPDDTTQTRDVLTRFDAYCTARALADLANTALSAVSESVLLYRMLAGGRLAPLMLAVWLVQALPALDSEENRLWTQGAAYHIVNKDYRRLISMESLATDQLTRQEVLGLNLADWITKEYERCREGLQDVDLGEPWSLLHGTEGFFRLVLGDVCDEWPTLYYALSALFGWTSFSFATISSVQTQSWSLRWKFGRLFGQESDAPAELLRNIHKYAKAVRVRPDADESAVAYPCEDTSTDGMALEFRDITFSYPNAKAKKPALENLTVSIEPGQLVVIVGENGSGKSTLTKLLTRQHEPSTGTLHIDGQPARAFKRAALREATAALSQEHDLFAGLSVADDVALGHWHARERSALVADSLHLGGAAPVVAKLAAGADTVLRPRDTKGCVGLASGHALWGVYDKLEKSASVSGGELQRLVAARTFMRINTGDVRLVVVDEPSAAMDPAGEFALFKNLREARRGKTMIFITHRFGHLTRHADLVLCMKDGRLVEQGTHAELVARKGEYFKLYQVQAQAFTAEAEAGP